MSLVLAYLRVSTEKQKQFAAPFEIQKQYIINYCKTNDLQLEEENIFSDTSSGSNIDRPGLTALREKIASANKVKAVLVYSIDRLTRSVLDGEILAKEIKNKKGSILSVTQGFDDNTPHGNMIRQTLTVIAELERTTIKQRTRNGSEKSRKQGKHVGVAPLGYDNVGTSITKGFGQLKVNEKEKEIVLDIFDLRKRGYTIREIVSELTLQNKLTRKGTPFNPGSIQRILDNKDFYQGKISSEAYAIEDLEAQHQRIL